VKEEELMGEKQLGEVMANQKEDSFGQLES
jgi:hypothetical protein